MFELEEVITYRVYGREFYKKDDALKYSMQLQYRQNLLDRMHLKILKIKDWSMEILVDDCHRILILDDSWASTRALYKQLDENGRYKLTELDICNLPRLYCPHGSTYKSLVPELRKRMLESNIEDLIEEINKINK